MIWGAEGTHLVRQEGREDSLSRKQLDLSSQGNSTGVNSLQTLCSFTVKSLSLLGDKEHSRPLVKN